VTLTVLCALLLLFLVSPPIDAPLDSSENLISLSDAYSSTLQRLHAHLVRIYSPGLRNLARVPEVWTDGTAATMVDTVATRLTDGSAFRLVGRMWDSLGSVHAQLEERRKRRGGGEGDPFGGSQPPVGGGGAGPGLPPLPPLPPPAAGAPRAAQGDAVPAGGHDAVEQRSRGAPPAPGGRPAAPPEPPKVVALACAVM